MLGAQLNSLRDALAAHHEGLSLPPGNPLDGNTFYPIRGAQNLYPTYPQGDHRNAVAGDYDLFAVWPLRGLHTSGDLLRYSISPLLAD